MKCLIDAHVLIWAADHPEKLSVAAIDTLQNPDNSLCVSSGTLWEICIKVGLGKLQLNNSLEHWLNTMLRELQVEVVPISVDHAVKQSALPFHHRDPFDRLIASQALIEAYPLVSADSIFDKYGVQRIW